MPSFATTVLTAKDFTPKAKKSKTKKDVVVVEEQPTIVVEEIAITNTEEVGLVLQDEQQVKIFEEPVKQEEEVEEDEEDEDENALFFLKAQTRELENKLKQKELKKNITLLRKPHVDAFRAEQQRKEQQIKNILEEIDIIKQSILNVENGCDDELLIRAELAKANKPQTIITPKKRGGGGKLSNLQSKLGSVDFFRNQDINLIYFKDIFIDVRETDFVIRGREETYKSTNEVSVGYFTHFKNAPKQTINTWTNMYYDDKQSGKKEKIDKLRQEHLGKTE